MSTDPHTEPPAFGLQDASWSDEDWFRLLNELIQSGFFSWKDVATLALGQANPPQVGTSIASSPGFQRNLRRPDGPSVMQQVYEWLYDQAGRCVECGSRLDLQVDHIDPREDALHDPAEVDRLENLVLRCRRHNVIRRRSHKLGGKTHLTAETALMWILLVLRPRTILDYVRMCRLYGMSMADVRMREAWGMAMWLAREGTYAIESEASRNVLLLWPEDGALTRRWSDDRPVDAEPEPFAQAMSPDLVSFVIRPYPVRPRRLQLHTTRVASVPFSIYDLYPRPPYALAVKSQQPRANEMGDLISLELLPPRGSELLAISVHPHETRAVAVVPALRGV